MKLVQFKVELLTILLLVLTSSYADEEEKISAKTADEGQYQEVLAPFLADETPEVIKEFATLLKGYENKTESTVNSEIEAWVNEKGGKIKERYEESKKQADEYRVKMEKIREQAMSRLSSDAQAAIQKLIEIETDQDLTLYERSDKAHSFFEGLSAEIRKELTSGAIYMEN